MHIAEANRLRKSVRPRTESAWVCVMACIRAALLCCILTASLILLLAFFLKQGIVPLSSVRLINTLIKAVSAGTAGLLCASRLRTYAGVYGGLSGLLYLALAYLLFSFIERSFVFDWGTVSDLALGFLCGLGTATILKLIREIRDQQT